MESEAFGIHPQIPDTRGIFEKHMDERLMKACVTKSFHSLPTIYAELVALHMPRPIHDEVAYRNTVQIIDAMAGHPLNDDQEDYLQLLSQTVEAYENEIAPLSNPLSGLESLRFLLQENDLGGDDLASILAVDRSTAFKILKGTRRLTAEHIRKLASRFHVSADLFLVRG